MNPHRRSFLFASAAVILTPGLLMKVTPRILVPSNNAHEIVYLNRGGIVVFGNPTVEAWFASRWVPTPRDFYGVVNSRGEVVEVLDLPALPTGTP